MRAAQEIMGELAASGLNAEQIALVIELSAAVATEARPVLDKAAENKRAYDREYQRGKRGNRKSRTKSYEQYDKNDPPKERSNPLPVSDETDGKPSDPVKELFDLGTSVLVATGKTEKEARSLVGMWRKAHGDGEVLAALTDCRTKAISNPVEWVPKRLAQRGSGEPADFLAHYRRQQATAGASR